MLKPSPKLGPISALIHAQDGFYPEKYGRNQIGSPRYFEPVQPANTFTIDIDGELASIYLDLAVVDPKKDKNDHQ